MFFILSHPLWWFHRSVRMYAKHDKPASTRRTTGSKSNSIVLVTPWNFDFGPVLNPAHPRSETWPWRFSSANVSYINEGHIAAHVSALNAYRNHITHAPKTIGSFDDMGGGGIILHNICRKHQFGVPLLISTLVHFNETDDYKGLCMPNIPFLNKEKQKMPFFGVEEKLPLLVAAVMGLQHAFAMVGGLVKINLHQSSWFNYAQIMRPFISGRPHWYLPLYSSRILHPTDFQYRV